MEEKVGENTKKVNALFGNSCIITIIFETSYGEIYGCSCTAVEMNKTFRNENGRIAFVADPVVYSNLTLNFSSSFYDVTLKETTKKINLEPNNDQIVRVSLNVNDEWRSKTTESNIRVSRICDYADIVICGSGGQGAYAFFGYSNRSGGVCASGGAGGYHNFFRVTPKNGVLGSVTIGSAVQRSISASNSSTVLSAVKGMSGQTTTFIDAENKSYIANGGSGGFAISQTTFPAYVSGADGGSGSGGVYLETASNKYVGVSGQDGSDGENASDSFDYGLGGKGQTPFPDVLKENDIHCSAGGSVGYNGGMSSSSSITSEGGIGSVSGAYIADLSSTPDTTPFKTVSMTCGTGGIVIRTSTIAYTQSNAGTSGIGICYIKLYFRSVD